MPSCVLLVFNFFPGEDPRIPTKHTHKRDTWKHCKSFLITPLLRAEDYVIMIQIIVIYLLIICDCQILKTKFFFICA